MASAFALGIERFNDGQQFGPRNDFLHAGEELLAPGDLLLIGELDLGKTRLVDHAHEFRKRPLLRLH